MTASRALARRLILEASAIAAGFWFAFAAHGADETAPVQKPDVKVGDRWTYRITSYRTNVPQVSTVKVHVAFVDANLITTITTDESGQERDSQYTSEWNAISLSTGQVFKEPQRFFKFPMRPGDSHPFTFEAVAMRGTSDRWKAEGETRVARWEDVVVPVGKFRALKLEVKNTFQGLSSTFFGWARREIWYVPEIKRFVRVTYAEGSHGNTSPDNSFELDLVDHAVK